MASDDRREDRPRQTGVLAPLRNRAFSVLVVGYAVSAIGDGMAIVAVSWLAISLAHGHDAGLIVGGAVAAYTLPGVVAWLLLARLFVGWDGRKLVLTEAVLRATSLAAVAALAWSGNLDPVLYVALLGVSSLFGLLGVSGDLAAVVELLGPHQQLAGNSLVTMASFSASIVGPALAGGVIAVAGAATAIAVDAASFVVLLLAAVVSRRFVPPPPEAPAAGGGALATLRLLKGLPAVVGITALCVVFFAVYGPVEVALPVLVAAVLHAGAGALGGYWTLFSVGAAVGALGTSRLERFGMWRVVAVSVAGWGVCLIPLGLVNSLAVGFGSLAAGGFFYGPFLPLKASIIQRDASPDVLTAVAGASALFTTPAAPVGAALGGPIVAAIGARATLTGSGLVTVATAGLATAVLIGRKILRGSDRHKFRAI